MTQTFMCMQAKLHMPVGKFSSSKEPRLQDTEIEDIKANRPTTKKRNKLAESRQAHCNLSCASGTILSRRHNAANLHTI